jgi:hypothetical protein
VILPLTVLRPMHNGLECTEDQGLDSLNRFKPKLDTLPDELLRRATGHASYSLSPHASAIAGVSHRPHAGGCWENQCAGNCVSISTYSPERTHCGGVSIIERTPGELHGSLLPEACRWFVRSCDSGFSTRRHIDR